MLSRTASTLLAVIALGAGARAEFPCRDFAPLARFQDVVPTERAARAVDATASIVVVGDDLGITTYVQSPDDAPPTLAGRLDLGVGVSRIEIHDDRAYAAAGSLLVAVDVIDPAAPIETGRVVLPYPILDLAAGDPGVLAVHGLHGLSLLGAIDLEVLDHRDTPGVAGGVDLRGNRVFVADGLMDLQVFEVEQNVLRHLGETDWPGHASDVAVLDEHLVVADELRGVQVLEISENRLPVRVRELPLEGGTRRIDGRGIVAVVGRGSGFHTELRLISAMIESRLGLSTPLTTRASFHDVALGPEHLVVAGGGSGIVRFRARIPVVPAPLARVEGAGGTILEVSGNLAFVGPGIRRDLRILDISDPRVPRVVFERPTWTDDLWPDGDRLWVISGVDGIEVFDVSDPVATIRVGAYAIPGEHIHVEKGRAFVVDGSVLEIYDVTDLAAPVLLHAIEVGTVRSLEVDWPLAVLAVGTSVQVRRLFLDEPAELLATVERASAIRSMALDGTRLVLALPEGGIELFDLSDPGAPIILGRVTVPTRDAVHDVAVNGNLALTQGAQPELTLYDLTDPARPALVGSMGTGVYGYGVVLGPDLVFALDRGGFAVYLRPCVDESTPDHAMSATHPAAKAGVELRARLTTGGVVASFTLAERRSVTLDAHDVRGRRLARILDDVVLGPGAHHVSWDGRRQDGRRIGAGVVFLDLRSATARLDAFRLVQVR